MAGFLYLYTVFLIICTSSTWAVRVYTPKGLVGKSLTLKNWKEEFSKMKTLAEIDNKFFGGSIRGKDAATSGFTEPLQYGKCSPYNQTVRLELPTITNPNTQMWPDCVIVERCLGCCSSHEFSCLPTKVYQREVKVYQYTVGSTAELVILDVKVDVHESCGCRCKDNCNKDIQFFKDCKCRCLKTKLCGSKHKFDEKTCSCVCTEKPTCGSQQTFDATGCSCKSSKDLSTHGRATRRREPQSNRCTYHPCRIRGQKGCQVRNTRNCQIACRCFRTCPPLRRCRT